MKKTVFLLFLIAVLFANASNTVFTTSTWEISSTTAKKVADEWVNNNHVYAQLGSEKGKSFISTSAAGKQTCPQRLLDSKKFLAVSNLNTGDALCFEIPVASLTKGSYVDFMLTLYPKSPNVPKYWIFEYWDNNKWNTVKSDLKTANEDATLKYSFYLKYRENAHYTTFVQNFKLAKPIKNANLKMRCRVVGNYTSEGEKLTPDASASVALMSTNYLACCINTYQGVPETDHIKIGILGNSFTYYSGEPFMLKEIAQTQGHGMTMCVSLKGGQTFGDHLQLPLSQSVMSEKNYNYVILQDQSYQHAFFWKDSITNKSALDNSILVTKKFRVGSPKVTSIIENTWAYANKDNKYMDFGNYETFDKYLQEGAKYICEKTNSWESPAGFAFQKAREQGITDLYCSDHKHPNRNGAYLIACTNYLLIYGKPFDKNVPDCSVDTKIAQKLRTIAEEVVLPNINQWRKPYRSFASLQLAQLLLFGCFVV